MWQLKKMSPENEATKKTSGLRGDTDYFLIVPAVRIG